MWHQYFRGYWTDLLVPLHTTYTVFAQCWTTFTEAATRIAPPLPLCHAAEPLEPGILIFSLPPPSLEAAAACGCWRHPLTLAWWRWRPNCFPNCSGH
jgi:hypothetical protein